MNLTIYFLLSITYVLPEIVFDKCFTWAPASPISSVLWNLPGGTSTAPIDIDVNGNSSMIPFLFGTSK